MVGNETCYFVGNRSRFVTGNDSLPQDEAIKALKYYVYGIAMPSICILGLIGNVLNLVVLTRPNMKGAAYIYMRGYALAALVAISGAFPFCLRILELHEVGNWTNYWVAFFHVYIELYIGNAFLGTGVLMLVALTTERFISVCYPAKSREMNNEKRAYLIVTIVPIMSLAAYIPYIFRSVMVQCTTADGQLVYQKRENIDYHETVYYTLYQWMLEAVFRLCPTIVLAYLNIAIIIAYRKVLKKRRAMTSKLNKLEKQVFAEEHRLMFLLGGTSFLFFVCITPIVVIHLLISEALLTSYSFQSCRAAANILEITNFALSFYIYCVFSREFRETFFRTIHLMKNESSHQVETNITCNNHTGNNNTHNFLAYIEATKLIGTKV